MQNPSENISIIFGASSFLLLITLFIVMLIMAYLRRDLKHLKEKESMEADFEKQLLQSQLETQEETLNQLSIEIHDNVGQLLNSTKLLIGLTQRAQTETSETLTLADETLAKAIQEIRSLSKALNKEWLQQFNFMENLEAEINRINAAKSLQLHLYKQGLIGLQPDKQIILFRIVQEVLQNAIKHAKAKNISISIIEEATSLSISVKDDGIGFNEENIIKSVGILNIKQRTYLLKGKVQWLSSEQNGTLVTLQIPVTA
jgi:signal transduction histidine kinase